MFQSHFFQDKEIQESQNEKQKSKLQRIYQQIVDGYKGLYLYAAS